MALENEDTLALDFEWSRETGEFRAGCWWDGKPGGGIQGTVNAVVAKYRLGEHMYSHPDCRVVAHNATADLTKMVEWGIRLPDNLRIADSMIIARLLFPDIPTKKLKPFAREFGFDWEEESETEDLDRLLKYCARDTYACEQVYRLLFDMASEDQQKLIEMNNKFVRAYWSMEMAAVKVDEDYLEAAAEVLSEHLGELLPRIPIGFTTDDNAFREWLHEVYTPEELAGMPTTHKTKEIALDTQSLSLLPHDVEGLGDILDARKRYDYLKNFVLNPRDKSVSGYYPATYKILVARTHRRSTEPTIQNWPAEARRALVPRMPEGRFASIDFKNLEARLFAWQCKCDNLLEHLIEGGYPKIARTAFGWTIEDKTDPNYKVTKSLVLAIMYNMGDWLFRRNLKLQHGLDKSEEEVAQWRHDFFSTYPEVFKEIEYRKKYMHATGYAIPVVGEGIQPLEEVKPDYFPQGEARKRTNSLENKAVNNPTQMLASYVTGCALIDMLPSVLEWNNEVTFGTYTAALYQSRTKWPLWLKGFPVLEIHDELVFEGANEKFIHELVDIASFHMTHPMSLKEIVPDFDCPLEVEVGISKFLSKI